MLGAVFAGALKAGKAKRSRMRNKPKGPKKKRPAFLGGKEGQPLGGRSKRRRRLKPKEESIARIRREQRRTSSARKPRTTKPAPKPVRLPSDKLPIGGKKPRTTKPAPKPVEFHRDPKRTPGKPRPTDPIRTKRRRTPEKTRPTDLRRTPGKPRVQEPSRTERVSKELPSKVPSVRKRRRSKPKGPSYTTSSLNV